MAVTIFLGLSQGYLGLTGLDPKNEFQNVIEKCMFLFTKTYIWESKIDFERGTLFRGF
jgi:hypothetical protein